MTLEAKNWDCGFTGLDCGGFFFTSFFVAQTGEDILRMRNSINPRFFTNNKVFVGKISLKWNRRTDALSDVRDDE